MGMGMMGLWNDAVNVCIIVRGKNLHFLYCSFRMSFLSIRSEITLTDSSGRNRTMVRRVNN